MPTLKTQRGALSAEAALLLSVSSRPHTPQANNTNMVHEDTLALVEYTCKHYRESSIQFYMTSHVGVPIDLYPQTPHIASVNHEVKRRLRSAAFHTVGDDPSSCRPTTRASAAAATPYPITQQGRSRARSTASAAALPPAPAITSAIPSSQPHTRRSSRTASTSSGIATLLDASRRAFTPSPTPGDSADLDYVEQATSRGRMMTAAGRPNRAASNRPAIAAAPTTTTEPASASKARSTKHTPQSPADDPSRLPPGLSPGYIPVITGIAGKRPCPRPPPGQRHTVAYQNAVSNWIKERTMDNKLTKLETEYLLINNFMRGKVYFRHPLNEEYDEATNLDPECWGTYTEWGKSLIPEAVIYNRLTPEEREKLYDWPDRDIWKALFVVIWLGDYCDRHTRVMWYRQCMRCQRGGWPCLIGHDMFHKNDIKYRRVKKGRESNACIPCRGSKASCSHAHLRDPLEEYGWATADLEAYWDNKITLSELFALREVTSSGTGPYDVDSISTTIDEAEDAEFYATAEGGVSTRGTSALPPIAARTTVTPYMRQFIEGRDARRTERAKVLAGQQGAAEHKKLLMIQYIAKRLREGTLTHPTFSWKDYEKNVRDLPKTNRSRKAQGLKPLSPEELCPYPDFYDFWCGNKVAEDESEDEESPTVSRPTTRAAPRRRGASSAHLEVPAAANATAREASTPSMAPTPAGPNTPLQSMEVTPAMSMTPLPSLEPTPALSDDAPHSTSPATMSLLTPDLPLPTALPTDDGMVATAVGPPGPSTTRKAPPTPLKRKRESDELDEVDRVAPLLSPDVARMLPQGESIPRSASASAPAHGSSIAAELAPQSQRSDRLGGRPGTTSAAKKAVKRLATAGSNPSPARAPGGSSNEPTEGEPGVKRVRPTSTPPGIPSVG